MADHKFKVSGIEITLRSPKRGEVAMVSEHTVSAAFDQKDHPEKEATLRRVKEEYNIQWILRVVQSHRDDAISYVIEAFGRPIGSVIVTREEGEARKHSAKFELYLLDDIRGTDVEKDIEKEIFRVITHKIRSIWNDEVHRLKAFSSTQDSIVYQNCGFTKGGAIIMSMLSPDGLYWDEIILYKQI